jgi:hypothetical protein
MLWCALAKEQHSSGSLESLPAGVARVALDVFLSMAVFDDILLCLTVLQLAVVRAGFIWTKFSRFGKSFHLSPSMRFA